MITSEDVKDSTELEAPLRSLAAAARSLLAAIEYEGSALFADTYGTGFNELTADTLRCLAEAVANLGSDPGPSELWPVFVFARRLVAGGTLHRPRRWRRRRAHRLLRADLDRLRRCVHDVESLAEKLRDDGSGV